MSWVVDGLFRGSDGCHVQYCTLAERQYSVTSRQYAGERVLSTCVETEGSGAVL